MTGRFSFRVGLQYFTTLRPGSEQGLPSTANTLGEVLQSQGYSTHMIGKWHLGAASESTHLPNHRGFDSFRGFLGGMENYYNHTLSTCAVPGSGRAGCFYPIDADRPGFEASSNNGAAFDFWENEDVFYDSFGYYSEILYYEKFSEIIHNYERNASSQESYSPFFIYYSHQLAHIPLEVPPDPKHYQQCDDIVSKTQIELSDMDENHTNKNRPVLETRKMLCATVSALDSFVGQSMNLLKSNDDTWANTLVWAVSDNGGMVSFGVGDPLGSSASSNWPLRGGKTTLFEGGIRSVSFVTGGLLPSSSCGRILGAPWLLHAVDVLPTFTYLAQEYSQNTDLIDDEETHSHKHSLNLSKGNDYDGVNIWEYLESGGRSVPLALTLRKQLPVHVDVNPLSSSGVSEPISSSSAHLDKEPVDGIANGYANYSVILSWPWKLIAGTPTNPALAAEDAFLLDGYWTISPYVRLPPPITNYQGLFLLYNLENDEEENNNVAEDYPAIVKELSISLNEYWVSEEHGFVLPKLNAPMPKANPVLWNWTWSPFLS